MRNVPNYIKNNNRDSYKLKISDTKADYIKYDNTKHQSRKRRSIDR